MARRLFSPVPGIGSPAAGLVLLLGLVSSMEMRHDKCISRADSLGSRVERTFDVKGQDCK